MTREEKTEGLKFLISIWQRHILGLIGSARYCSSLHIETQTDKARNEIKKLEEEMENEN